MSLRDTILPLFDVARTLVESVGLRRFAVTARRRVWSGPYTGDGIPTNQDIVISPTPKVRAITGGSSPQGQLEYVLANADLIKDRYYKIDKITPEYSVNGVSGGYSVKQLLLRVDPDLRNIEPVIVLVGDDGYLRECVQLAFGLDRAFGYSMIVKETDRPKVALASISVTPSSPSVATGQFQQFVATGTFADGSTSDISTIVLWSSSDATKATIDIIGKAHAIAVGTSSITARLGLIVAPPVTMTVTT